MRKSLQRMTVSHSGETAHLLGLSCAPVLGLLSYCSGLRNGTKPTLFLARPVKVHMPLKNGHNWKNKQKGESTRTGDLKEARK